jgi:NAD(P)-dependent dehydrogenase (short-subunit alcohol dehydrogenase family)
VLTGKTAIVTGGARGIGAGIARVLASQGARVAILDLDGAEAEKTAAALPVPHHAAADHLRVSHDGCARSALPYGMENVASAGSAGIVASHAA